MASLLLAIIYMAFISLGLPDSLLGSAWPAMRLELGVPVSFAGVVSMIISGGTIVSSLLSSKVIHKLGVGPVTAISVGMTACALLGFSASGEFYQLCLWAVPYGLGAGAVDAALNNYVAVHYSSRHMSWLHGFWGIGVTVSPYIMGSCLANQRGWQAGYRTVSVLQVALTAVLFLSLRLWKREGDAEDGGGYRDVPLRQAVRIPGAPQVLAAFFGFCALETTAGLWASSYLVGARGVGPETAARFTALFYMGETVGRFLNGLISDKLGDRAMIRIGVLIMLAGTGMVLLPVEGIALAGLVTVGLGAAPVYPCIIHSTPASFGKENSQALVGIQMASAYCGSTFMPPLFGLIAQYVDVGLYPFYLLAFAVLMLVMTEWLNRVLAREGRAVR